MPLLTAISQPPYASIMNAFWKSGGLIMATLTIKNVPEKLHKRLKESAVQHRRSINSEAISCLENVLVGTSRGSPGISGARSMRDAEANALRVSHGGILARSQE